MRPSCSTTSRSARSAATPRSCVTSSTAVPFSRRSSSIRSRMRRCTVTSSALVGSSATISAGLRATAMAISTRCFMPPDSSCGYCLARISAGVRPTRSSRSMHARLDGLAVAALVDLQHLGELRADGAHRIERAAGILWDQADDGAADGIEPLLRPVCDVGAVEADGAALDAAVAGQQAERRPAPSWSCPSPISPTRATTSPGSTLKETPWTTRCSWSPVL